MFRTILAPFLFVCAWAQAQTYFYIDQVVVDPQPATTQDVVSIDLIGNLSSSGSYIVSATADVTGSTVSITVVAGSTGGLTVLVPHTETIVLGQLPPGVYTVAYSLGSQSVLFPPDPVSFVVEGGGSPCDSLEIASIRYHAFTDTAIVLHVFNNSSQLFDYPNFVLFDESGDTLAVETVNFFGIASESWHILDIHQDATLPNAPFYGALHLWSDFTTVLECEWMPFIDLCPPAPCSEMFVMVQNTGGALAIGTYSWTLYDDAFLVVATGQMEMTGNVQYDSDTLCLPAGDYSLALSPDLPPTGGQPMFGVGAAGWISGPTQPVVWSLPTQMPFSYYEACIDGSNAIDGPSTADDLEVRPTGNGVLVHRNNGQPLGRVTLHDATGRVLYDRVHASDSERIDMDVTGLVLVRVNEATVRTMVLHN